MHTLNASHCDLSLQHVCKFVVERRKGAVRVMHSSAEGVLMLCWHEAQHCIMPNGCMLGLALSMNLQTTCPSNQRASSMCGAEL